MFDPNSPTKGTTPDVSSPSTSEDTSMTSAYRPQRGETYPTSSPEEAQPKEVDFRKLGQQFKEYSRRRYQILWSQRWVVLGVILFIIIIFATEQIVFPWLAAQFRAGGAWLAAQWNTRPVTVFLIALALLFLLFDHRRLVRIGRWGLARWKLLLVLLFILLTILLYTTPVADRWVFIPAEVGLDGVQSQRIATQFRGSLNSIGIKPFEAIDLTVMEAKFIDNALKTQREIELTDCDSILSGQRTFRVLDTIPFAKSKIGVSLDSAQQLSVSTVVGNVNLPLENLVRFFLVTFAPGFREFRTQVIPATGANEIQIVINDNRGEKWTVEGPLGDLPQLIEFLAYRIKIDDLKTPDGQQQYPIENIALAMALGNQAFDNRLFESALAYYRLAEWFDSRDAASQIMLGLTYFQLSVESSGDAATSWQLQARRPFEQAIALTADSKEPTKNIGFYPYSACLYAKLGSDENENLANNHLAVFNTFIQDQRRLEPSSEEATQVRLAALGERPLLGPGRYLSIFKRMEANSFDLYYLSDKEIHYVRNDSSGEPALITQTQVITAGDLRGGEPLQLFAVDAGAYYLTRDGRVKFFSPGQEVTAVIDYDDFNEPAFSGGIRQIFAQEEYLFVVNQLGQIVRLPPNHPALIHDQATAVTTSLISDTRQIYLDGNNLFALKNDGTIWQIKNPFDSNLQEQSQLVSETANQEILVDGGLIYMRRANGSMWRHRIDAVDVEANLQIVTEGGATDVNRIFIEATQGLFLLKKDGTVSLLRNPSNPSEKDVQEIGLDAANRPDAGVLGSTLITLKEIDPGIRQLDPHPIPAPQVEEPMLPTATPTQTPTPTSTSVPTETPMPTHTPTPASSPTPTPDLSATTAAIEAQEQTTATMVAIIGTCPDGAQGEFRDVWERYQGRLGCPQQNEPIIGGLFAFQEFEHGFMFWTSELDLVISVLKGDDPTWSANNWSEFVPNGSICADEVEPAPEQYVPINAFGAVWCENPEIQQALGFGTEEERGIGGGIQQFEGGFILRDEDQSMVYTLFNDEQTYRWEENP